MVDYLLPYACTCEIGYSHTKSKNISNTHEKLHFDQSKAWVPSKPSKVKPEQMVARDSAIWAALIAIAMDDHRPDYLDARGRHWRKVFCVSSHNRLQIESPNNAPLFSLPLQEYSIFFKAGKYALEFHSWNDSGTIINGFSAAWAAFM